MNDPTTTWYILKTPTGTCQIVTDAEFNTLEAAASQQQWGPYSSQSEAVARRVGLIRAGKCQPQ